MSILAFLTGLMGDDEREGMDPDDPRFSPPRYPNPMQQEAAPQDFMPAAVPTPQGPPALEQNEDINVMGDTWKARGQTILGALADAYMSTNGMGTPFTDERNNRNMREAMEGFVSDPEQAIRRISQFNPDEAWKMHNQHVDNKRQQGSLDRQNKVYDLSVEKMVDSKIGGLLYSAAQSGNPALIAKARDMAIRLGNQYGIDYSERLPADNAGIEDFALMAMGHIPAPKQMQANVTTRGQDIRERTALSGQQVARERNQVLATQGDQRIGVSQQNADSQRMNAETTRTNAERKNAPPTNVVTPYGAGQISPDGKRMVVPINEDRGDFRKGDKLVFIKMGNQWVPSGQAKNFGPKPKK